MAIPILNDPFSRWGWGGYGVKINNFFPQQYGGDCGCGGRMQAWMFGMMAMNQVLGGIFNMFKPNDGQGAIQQTPAQMGMSMYGGMPMASTFYPYVNFQHAPYGDGLGGNSHNNTAVQQAKIKNLLQLPENKKLYSGIVTNPDGSGYLIKDKKSVPFSNLDELESMLQENVGKEVEDTEPEEDPDNKTKVKPDNKPETDPDNRVENDPDNKVETEPGNTVEAEDNGAAPKAETKKKFTYPKLNGNNTWINYNKSNKKNDSIKVGMTVEELVKIIGPLPPYSIEGTIELYEKANPNAIKDGKIVDLNKLDIIVSTNNKKSDNKAASEKAEDSKKQVIYEASNIGLKKLETELEAYDNNNGDKIGALSVHRSGNDIEITVNYKGNGFFRMWQIKVKYTNAYKNGGISDDIKTIYNKVMQSYNKHWDE